MDRVINNAYNILVAGEKSMRERYKLKSEKLEWRLLSRLWPQSMLHGFSGWGIPGRRKKSWSYFWLSRMMNTAGSIKIFSNSRWKSVSGGIKLTAHGLNWSDNPPTWSLHFTPDFPTGSHLRAAVAVEKLRWDYVKLCGIVPPDTWSILSVEMADFDRVDGLVEVV